MDLDVALFPGFADARLGLLMFALFEGGSESPRNRLDLSRVAASGTQTWVERSGTHGQAVPRSGAARRRLYAEYQSVRDYRNRMPNADFDPVVVCFLLQKCYI